ncbi:1-acyl-sn-glycerol-3-phosphate acyltransferase [Spongiibacter tropicus]|uniref:1-acyl-sn-glycerol-3-phosphate acyltransferase n=1 Tax=Spongiibacter tropicus TaxID=454602 RepID=UPI0024E23AB9|nr:1-acyl-sn-glycerol-3-phosphate acyltransferase [Spongiibacter tropicus]
MDEFADIRPYHDNEVRDVLDRLLIDPELIAAVASLRMPRLNRWFPGLLRPLVSRILRRQLTGVDSVAAFQSVVKVYMDQMIEGSTREFVVSGVEHLSPGKAYLFISNHRDIALDPAFVNYALYHNGLDTVRIAIGDNLLSKPFAADLMRINKSFIVQRSAKGPRQMLAAFRKLSNYIRHSLLEERASIWIAQREGRAKDGNDATEVALIKMIGMSQDKGSESFTEFVAAMNVVPVSISYEWDPLDAAKARELVQIERDGAYQKAEHEDLKSIGTGIVGNKGRVHVHFGPRMQGDYADAAALAAALDREIIGNYPLHSSNVLAYMRLHDDARWRALDLPEISDKQVAEFDEHFAKMPPDYRRRALEIYAQPLVNQLRLKDVAQETANA